ncbi:MAG: enoyl-CoA hydratase/isomerase family protein, partial [Deltaproteobacteria bacterium]
MTGTERSVPTPAATFAIFLPMPAILLRFQRENRKANRECGMVLDTVLYDVDDGVALIRLNRPQRMNAVNERLYSDLISSIGEARKDDRVRAVVLTGTVLERNGQRKQAFCAGADLKEHAEGKRSGWQKRKYLLLANEACLALCRLPKPVVAAVNGPARGAGVELALNCDFIVMAESATLALTETSLGSFVGGGATKLLERMVGVVQARRLIYTGHV